MERVASRHRAQREEKERLKQEAVEEQRRLRRETLAARRERAMEKQEEKEFAKEMKASAREAKTVEVKKEKKAPSHPAVAVPVEEPPARRKSTRRRTVVRPATAVRTPEPSELVFSTALANAAALAISTGEATSLSNYLDILAQRKASRHRRRQPRVEPPSNGHKKGKEGASRLSAGSLKMTLSAPQREARPASRGKSPVAAQSGFKLKLKPVLPRSDVPDQQRLPSLAGAQPSWQSTSTSLPGALQPRQQQSHVANLHLPHSVPSTASTLPSTVLTQPAASFRPGQHPRLVISGNSSYLRGPPPAAPLYDDVSSQPILYSQPLTPQQATPHQPVSHQRAQIPTASSQYPISQKEYTAQSTLGQQGSEPGAPEAKRVKSQVIP